MIDELRRIELELDSNRADLNLLERYIVLSQRFGRDFVKDWFPFYFDEIKKFFNKNKNMMERYIELQYQYSFGHPSFEVYCMVRYCGSDRSWAEKVIENAKTGDPSKAVFCMVKFCGSDRKWAEKIIEDTEMGNPAFAAYLMVEHCESSQEWADKVRESWESRSD